MNFSSQIPMAWNFRAKQQLEKTSPNVFVRCFRRALFAWEAKADNESENHRKKTALLCALKIKLLVNIDGAIIVRKLFQGIKTFATMRSSDCWHSNCDGIFPLNNFLWLKTFVRNNSTARRTDFRARCYEVVRRVLIFHKRWSTQL